MFWIWKQKTLELEAKIAQEQQNINRETQQAQSLYKYGRYNQQQLDGYFSPFLINNQQQLLNSLIEEDTPLIRGWNEAQWRQWQPEEINLSSILRIGELWEQRNNGKYQFKIPHFAPFIGQNKVIIITTDNYTREQGLKLLQSLVIRTALMFPHQARYTLLDPAGNGAAFPMRRYLPMVRESGDDLRRDINEVIKGIKRINENFLDAGSESFEQIPEEIRVNERFEFIFAADFPNKYDRGSIEALESVANTGPRTGRYLFIHYDQSQELPRDMSLNMFKNSAYININQGYSSLNSNSCQLQFKPDEPPEPSLQSNLLEILKNSKPPERKLDWDNIVGVSDSQWWTKTAEKIIETPVGGAGSSSLLNIWFGENNEGSPCAHGILGAMTGAGKSSLYHALILGLTIRYSPHELRLYLIDGKDGVEFQPYRHLPHVEVVSLHSQAELSRSILLELIQAKEYRNQVFNQAKVANLSDYYAQGQTFGKLPRIVLIVDEYQELFEGDQDGIASNYLLQLSAQGRSAGIHLLLASQRFGVPGMMHRDAIFGNVHLRMAMKMTDSDRQSLTEFGRRGKALLSTCDLPGKIVINDQAGDDSENANHLGKVAYLEAPRRQELIDKLKQKAHQEISPQNLPSTVVFDGKAQPNIIENPQLSKLLENNRWLTDQEWQILARKSSYEGGFNLPDWFSAERPKLMWLGQQFTVRSQAMMILRRKLAENALIIGSNNAVRYGILAGILVSLAVNGNPNTIQFSIFDRSMAETQWCETLSTICTEVLRPAGFQTAFSRDSKVISNLIKFLLGELDKRQQLSDDQRLKEKSIFVVMTELDQVDEMRRQIDDYGMIDSPLGKDLQRIYTEGSRLGIHVILSFSGVKPMMNIIDERRGLTNFNHRVALQMSEDESFILIKRRDASKLQPEPQPICAMYYNEETNKMDRFKPYSIESDIPLTEQVKEINNHLINWKQNP
jgi:DNA segregation ATPase FtsK/SpoIIIE, S-DNA-T family